MTLSELSEDLFQYICKLVRTSRIQGDIDFLLLRREIGQIFRDMEEKASSERLISKFETLKKVLFFFVDSTIAESSLSVAEEWNNRRLAHELDPPEYAGDNKFYEILNETLEDHSKDATELLAVFYQCLGLGFVGSPPEDISKIMERISGRIWDFMNNSTPMTIPVESYHVNPTDLRTPPTMKILFIGVALVGLTVVLLIANNMLFKWHTEDLRTALQEITSYEE